MKFIILYIIIYLINSIYCQDSPQLFANFLPYQNSECSGDSFGIGLSISVSGNCINNIASIANINSNQDLSWSLFIEALIVGIREFDNSIDGQCVGNSNFYSFKNSTCIITPPFLSYSANGNDSSIEFIKDGLPLNKQYSKFFITREPFYGLPASITQVYSKYNNNNNNNNNNNICSNNNLLYSIFISNSLEIQFNQTTSNNYISSILYQCDNNDAIQEVCKSNQQCNNLTLTTQCTNNENIYCKIN